MLIYIHTHTAKTRTILTSTKTRSLLESCRLVPSVKHIIVPSLDVPPMGSCRSAKLSSEGRIKKEQLAHTDEYQ